MEGKTLSPLKDSSNGQNNLCIICKKLFFQISSEEICQNCQLMRTCHPGYQELFREAQVTNPIGATSKDMSVTLKDRKPYFCQQYCSMCHKCFQSLETRLLCCDCELKIIKNMASDRQQSVSIATDINLNSPSVIDMACMSVRNMTEDQLMNNSNLEHIDENQNTKRRTRRNTTLNNQPFTEQYGDNVSVKGGREKLKTYSKYFCEYCGRNFQNSTFLKIHVRSHTGEKPYVCLQCGKGFSQSSSLKTHEKIKHSDEKPYKCNICDKSFAIQNYLKLHVRTHTKEKPYQCTICNDRYYSQQSSLSTHMKQKHP